MWVGGESRAEEASDSPLPLRLLLRPFVHATDKATDKADQQVVSLRAGIGGTMASPAALSVASTYISPFFLPSLEATRACGGGARVGGQKSTRATPKVDLTLKT